MSLSGQIAIVTGAGRGIGADTARALGAAGVRVVVSARKLADAEAVAAGIEGALPLACDVADPDAVDALVAETEARLGPATILVNNAGVIHPIGPLHEADPREWAAAVGITLSGAASVARAVLPGMLAAGRGTIVNLSSGAAHRPFEGWSAYCAAKAGLAMVTRSIALEYGEKGIRVFGFAPGVVDTGMQVEIRASGINPVSQLPRESLADPRLPAAAIVFLCTGGADSYVGAEVDIRDPAFRSAAGLPA
ncbi:SDR family oxidoreductase [Prosthecomicrobium pneumaticum]|uniref:NAD(P)-dependent dehydrogenase (Short-subunit alcohol dehydrogenase family) n=1 Tax=Prosthecomicrobium pneumaticum TaxID=81895 RepID=A0A7W9FPQ4_9HYPH|nr:SDR family oxidoreductase [Prosthecomicrobium pneumaticum]MBB5754518.1 NAD(P)-dependent dehydrogenase (short-subunit alcohol dehydrogenase family) [Prosthecomicrobium pneumaticum]